MNIDLGNDHYLRWIGEDSFMWHHPTCRAWSVLAFSGPKHTGHKMISRDPLTIEGSLLCPMGCGDHGFIQEGRWVPA